MNYSELTKEAKKETVRVSHSERGVIRAPLIGNIVTMDPGLHTTFAEALASPMAFECLTRAEGARVIPWLASSFQTEDGGKWFRFHLRDGVRFHDGRRLSSRDVRYSFEHLLLNPDCPSGVYLSSIRGAQNMMEGKARELEGFHIHSSQDFSIELEQPLSFMPALLSNPALSILPEGLEDFLGSWRQGVVGTGPYRIVSFEPGKLWKMEANPSYWRSGLPKTESLEFAINLSAQEIASGFRSGKLSIAYFLDIAETESLLHDPQFAAKHKEIAWISTFYMVFNSHQGTFTNKTLRKKVMNHLNVEAIVRETRRFAAPARTLTPPALLGYEPEKPTYQPVSRITDSEIVVSLSTAARGTFERLVNEVLQALRDMGFKIRISEMVAEQAVRQHDVHHDIIMVNWLADYPDADGVVFPLLYSQNGLNSQHASTPTISKLIEQARIETDQELRHSLYRKIEEEIREEALMIPLIHDQFHAFARPELQGLELNYFYPSINFESLSIRR